MTAEQASVMRVLRDHGDRTAADVAQRTGLTMEAAYEALVSLEGRGTVRLMRVHAKRGFKPAPGVFGLTDWRPARRAA